MVKPESYQIVSSSCSSLVFIKNHAYFPIWVFLIINNFYHWVILSCFTTGLKSSLQNSISTSMRVMLLFFNFLIKLNRLNTLNLSEEKKIKRLCFSSSSSVLLVSLQLFSACFPVCWDVVASVATQSECVVLLPISAASHRGKMSPPCCSSLIPDLYSQLCPNSPWYRHLTPQHILTKPNWVSVLCSFIRWAAFLFFSLVWRFFLLIVLAM